MRLPPQEGRVVVPVPRAAQDAPLDAVGPIGAAALEVPTRVVERGMVCLTMGGHARALLVDAPRMHDHVAITRVPMPRVVDDPVPVRADKGMTILAVVEAVLVVEKRWRLREEIPFRTQRIETHQPQRITLWSELERRHRG